MKRNESKFTETKVDRICKIEQCREKAIREKKKKTTLQKITERASWVFDLILK